MQNETTGQKSAKPTAPPRIRRGSPLRGLARLILPLAVVAPLSGCSDLSGWLSDMGLGAQPPADTTPEVAPSRKTVRNVQANLAELGYDPGPADGIAGNRTITAIKAYQKDAGIQQDGRITEQLARDLSAAVVAAGKKGGEPGTPPQAEVPFEVANADLPPFYEIGDRYVWSDGIVETVARVAGDKLFWQDSEGLRYTADRNFLVPPSSWTGPSGTGEASLEAGLRDVWPLRQGTELSFTVQRNGRSESWRCENGGPETVSVPAGTFLAVALACERTPEIPGEWTRRVWLYAPAVRHYIARTDTLPDGGKVSRLLLGIRPGGENWPPAVRAGLDKAIQEELSNPEEGRSGWWSSTVVREEYEIRPGPVRATDNGERCRSFELVAHSAGAARIFPAIACSSEGRTWRIPGDARHDMQGISGLTNAG